LTVVVVSLLATYVAVHVPSHLVDTRGLNTEKRLKAENDLRTTLVQALGGTILLVGLYFTARNVGITREGQITDRFTKAIDQLGQHGQEKLDVRLGGIYALERIAKDSETDHGPIMEVLTAFLREHAQWKPGAADSAVAETGTALSDTVGPCRLRTDFQAIVTVLGRRPRQRRRQEKGGLNLSNVDLRGADLSGAHLEGAQLRGAHLVKARLYDAHMDNADLRGAYLSGTNLTGAYGAHGPDLMRVNLSDAHLNGAKLCGAELWKARLYRAHLEEADLSGANLERADLSGAHLVKADLRDADLEGAYLGGANLKEADLRDANLEGAYLGGACLDGADFSGVNLTSAKGLTRVQVASAITDANTTWPVFTGDVPEAVHGEEHATQAKRQSQFVATMRGWWSEQRVSIRRAAVRRLSQWLLSKGGEIFYILSNDDETFAVRVQLTAAQSDEWRESFVHGDGKAPDIIPTLESLTISGELKGALVREYRNSGLRPGGSPDGWEEP
jgi:uncharacterized protein YjbI with pentapeptide repeats